MALQTHSLSTLIDKLAQSPAKPGDRIGTIQHLVETANTPFAADVSVMFAINPSTVRLLPPAGVAGVLHASDPTNLDLPRLDGITAQVLEQGILTIPDLAQHAEFQSTFKRWEGIRSFAAVALYTRQHRPLAILFLNFRRARQFDPEDLDLLQLFATQASLVLQHTRALRRYHEVANIGHEINQEINTAEVLFQNLLARLGGILDITHGFMLAVYVPQTHSLNVFLVEDCQYQAVPDQSVADLPGCEWVIENQQPLVIHHYSEEVAGLPVQLSNVVGTEAKVFETLIFLPLTSRGVPLGVLSLQHMRPHAYDDEDLRILDLLGNHVALALNNIRLYNNARWLNETGQILTQQLDKERVLQETVDHIRAATKADLVFLHSYLAASQLFDPLPRVSGELRAPSPPHPSAPRPDDMAFLIVQQNEPVFAQDSARLFETLNGDPQTRKGSFEQREQVRSAAAVPLCVGDEAVGVLFVNFRQPHGAIIVGGMRIDPQFNVSRRTHLRGLGIDAQVDPQHGHAEHGLRCATGRGCRLEQGIADKPEARQEEEAGNKQMRVAAGVGHRNRILSSRGGGQHRHIWACAVLHGSACAARHDDQPLAAQRAEPAVSVNAKCRYTHSC